MTFLSYLVVIQSLQTEKEYKAIFRGPSTLLQDNDRYSQFRISTNSDNPLIGQVLITESGQYSYKIYAQNSTTNLDIKGAVVWGELERGLMTFTGEDAWSMPNINIPDNVVYYE